jgi:hypothetical protein
MAANLWQAAIDWLVSEPGTCNFFHYSGHGGQVRDPTGNHPSGILDTICPVDFRENGQIDSDTLHQHLVSLMPPNSTLFVILDCCHSGSALELPYVYKSDDDGNVNMIDNLRQGIHLMGEASDLMMGGFSFNKLAEAQDLYAGATNFFRSFKHMGEQQELGLGADEDNAMYEQEHKRVTMFSGCRDDQTSADANIGGMSEGAMSWAFLETMKRIQNPNYLQVGGFMGGGSEDGADKNLGVARHTVLPAAVELHPGASAFGRFADGSQSVACFVNGRDFAMGFLKIDDIQNRRTR